MNNKRFSFISIFATLVIILQTLSSYINFGGFPITLTLIPIILSGAILGPYVSTMMGTIFGIVVSVAVITGVDPDGSIMFASRPVITIATCIIKGALAGFFGGFAYKLISNKKIAIIVSAAIVPITNTLILYMSLILFFDSTFIAMITAFMSVNFIVEFIINILLAPGLLIVIDRANSRGNL